MKSPVLQLTTVTVAALLSIVTTSTALADLVYENGTTDSNIRFNPGLTEVGDEIFLAAGPERNLTNFTFQYWGLNFGGSEDARLRIYKNDGAAAPAGPTILAPNTLLFDSGWFPIVATPRWTLIWDDELYVDPGADLNYVPLSGPVPDSFTWSVQFKDLGVGASAGVDLYDPPTVGGNYNEYWDNGGSGWQYRGTNTDNINFGARVYATVPEPTVIGLGLLGGLGVLVLRNRFARR